MPVLGIKELRKQFKDLKRSTGRNLSRRVARGGARIVRDEARATAPRRSGRGVRGIITAEGRAEVRTDAVWQIGFRRLPKERTAFYLRFIERGTKGHVISVVKERGRAHRRGHVRNLGDGRTRDVRAVTFSGKIVYQDKRVLRTKAGQFLGIAVFHPGVKARPFLAPALKNKTAAILDFARHTVAVALSDGIQGHFSSEGGGGGTD